MIMSQIVGGHRNDFEIRISKETFDFYILFKNAKIAEGTSDSLDGAKEKARQIVFEEMDKIVTSQKVTA